MNHLTPKDTGSLNTPLDWAQKACEAIMSKYAPELLPPEAHWHYHQGVFLLGMERCWRETKREDYYNYLKTWVDSQVMPDGSIKNYRTDELDDIQPGILLFDLIEQTGDERYHKALVTLVELLKTWPKNAEGGFWHKNRYPNQMWLDGLYMAGPIAVQYGSKFNHPEYFEMMVFQALLMAKHTMDRRTGLLFHGWDETRQVPWADSVTGQAPEFWGRAIGWYVVALLDMFDYLPEEQPGREELVAILKKLFISIIQYQDEKTGLWYQVVDKGDREDNWLETSCSCLYAYAIAKAIRKGYLDHSFITPLQKAYQGIIGVLRFAENGSLIIPEICVGTGIGDYPHYIARPRSENDLHGAGAFVLSFIEMHKVLSV
jgi:unsaturated rhamnogalacturonyl hydrolase